MSSHLADRASGISLLKRNDHLFFKRKSKICKFYESGNQNPGKCIGKGDVDLFKTFFMGEEVRHDDFAFFSAAREMSSSIIGVTRGEALRRPVAVP